MDRTARSLAALLRKEVDALQQGDVAMALSLSARKAALIEKLEAAPPDMQTAEILRRDAERAMRHLDAARRGIATARERLELIRTGASTRTYGRNGSRTEITGSQTKVERRA